MKIIVSTHQGNLYNEEVDYVVIHHNDGEFAILKDHIPVISIMDLGYIKLVKENSEFFVVIVSGIVEFHDNVVSVLAQEAQIGQNKESSLAHLLAVRKERLESNRKETVDLTQKEKELREHIRKSKAGHI